MSRRRDLDDEPSLFDLPLDGPATLEEDREPGPAGWEPLEEDEAAGARSVTGAARAAAPPEPALLPRVPAAVPAAGGRREPAPLSSRFLAGLADLAVHLALAVALLFGARLLGVEAGFGDWPALVLFLLVFSFLYTVLPLAFWGQTPGMAWAGLVARARGYESLTFGQTGRRWLGGLFTAALLGLPALLAAGGGRSLADRLSDSETFLT